MKIAVIGSGISGLSCAWSLSRTHDVTLYEANDYLGGHTHTVEVALEGVTHPVDTGFLVFNHRTYPQLTKLFESLNVQTTPSEMSFSVAIERNGRRTLEWAGTSLDSVFAQRINLARPKFLGMLADILRFNRLTCALATESDEAFMAMTVGEFLLRHRFSKPFRDAYLLPMTAAIWSCPPRQMLEFPMASLARFCHNHGLLQVTQRPQWYTVTNGASHYVKKLAQAVGEIRMQAARRVIRETGFPARVAVDDRDGRIFYDHVVLACHGDQALELLAQPSARERTLLGAIRYQPNHAVLHWDTSVLPCAKRAWAAWNYQCSIDESAVGSDGVCVHYLINRLQPVPFARPVLVSLNPIRPCDASKVLAEFDYAHPVFDAAAVAAQNGLAAIQGERNTWFAGAWLGYGFHEDGLKSGVAVANALLAGGAGVPRAWAA